MTRATPSDLVDIDVRLHHETHGPRSAWLVSTDGKIQNAVWVPKSQAELEPGVKGMAVLTCPEWLAIDKGLV